jgi:hypothetical protein
MFLNNDSLQSYFAAVMVLLGGLFCVHAHLNVWVRDVQNLRVEYKYAHC